MDYKEKGFTFESNIGIIVFVIFSLLSAYAVMLYLNVEQIGAYWVLYGCSICIALLFLGIYAGQRQLKKSFRYCDKGLIRIEAQELLSWKNLIWCDISYFLEKISSLKLKFLNYDKVVKLLSGNEKQLIYNLIISADKDVPVSDDTNTLEWENPDDYFDPSRKTIKNYLSPTILFLAILITILIFAGIYILSLNLLHEKSNTIENRIVIAFMLTLFIDIIILVIASIKLFDPLYTKTVIAPVGIFLICSAGDRKLILWKNISDIKYTKTDKGINIIDIKCSNYESFQVPVNLEEVKLSEVHKLFDLYHKGMPKNIDYVKFDKIEKTSSILSDAPKEMTPCTLSKSGKRSPYTITAGILLITGAFALSVLSKKDFSRIPHTLNAWLILIGVSALLPTLFGIPILWSNIKLRRRLKKIQYSCYGIKENNDAPPCTWDDLIAVNKGKMNNFVIFIFGSGQAITVMFIIEILIVVYAKVMHYINPEQTFSSVFSKANLILIIVLLGFLCVSVLLSIASALTQELIVLKKNAIIISGENTRHEIKFDRIEACKLVSEGPFQLFALTVKGVE